MKICFLAPSNSIHAHRWIHFFHKQGHEVHWISLYKDTIGVERGVHYYEIFSKNKIISIVSAIVHVRKILQNVMPHVFHVHSVALYGFVAACADFQPLIGTAWGSDVLEGKNSFFRRKILKYSLAKMRLITTDAQHMVEALREVGVRNDKIKIIYFGIDTERFKPFPRDYRFRRKLGIADNSLVVFSLRNFLPVYNIETLVKAIPAVLKEVPQTQFVLAGTGPGEGVLRQMVSDLHIQDNVIFAGKLDNEKLPYYFSDIDIYVSTSLSDAGISASTAESMACERPVIVTDSGENNLWIHTGDNGFIVPVRNSEILAEKICLLLRDSNLRAQYGRLGRETIVYKNNYEKEMLKVERLYAELKNESD